jgi:hypothetical protein
VFVVRLTTIAAAVAALTAVFTGAAAAALPSPTSGVELITGQSNSTANNPVIPLTASGLVAGQGSLTLGSHSGVLKFNVGSLQVTKSPVLQTQSLNRKACAVAGVDVVDYTITSGTGAFTGATGSGQATITYKVKEPKTAKGKCNFNAKPLTAHTVFWASGPIQL